MEMPRISVVVPFYNSQTTLRLCLEALECLRYENYEVILVDNNSTDDSFRIAESFCLKNPDIFKQLAEERQGPSFARNRGALCATGEIVAFTDSDCIPAPEWLKNLVREFENEAIGAVAGRVAGFDSSGTLDKFHSLYTLRGLHESQTYSDFLLVSGGFPTANLAVRKAVFEEIGGFDETMKIYSEDYDLCARIYQRNHKIRYTTDAIVYHKHRSTFSGTWRQACGFGNGHAALLKKHFNKLIIIDIPKYQFISKKWPIVAWIDLAGADKKAAMLLACYMIWNYLGFLLILYFIYLCLTVSVYAAKNEIETNFYDRIKIVFLLLFKSLALTWGRAMGAFKNKIICF